MPDHQQNEYVHYPPFRPSLRGCVGRDTRLAAAVYTCSCEAFWSISDNIWRSLVYKDRDTSLSDLFDELAQADLEHFRALGELFWALNEGENFPKPYYSYRKHAARSPHHQASHADAALWERRRNMDCFDALMKRTEDRVVLSVFSKILSCESSLCRRLEPFCKG